MEEKLKGDFTVCYSGGLDSTAVGLIMGRRFDGTVHLWTLDHRLGHLFVKWSHKHAEDLARVFGDERVFHTINDITDVFAKITLRSLPGDLRRYGHFIWCLGCQLSMVTKLIIYNLERRIPRAFLCSSLGGEYAVMSMRSTIREKKRIYLNYGIRFSTPLIEEKIDKSEERRLLQEAGIWVGMRFRRGVHGVQPICLPGLQHIGDVLFDWHTTYDPEKVAAYIRSREPLMDRYIREHFTGKGKDVDLMVQETRTRLLPFELAAIASEGGA
ncbi:hypothetical protein JW905_09810 [bacterium]|nr:hypothetical protein [candidate division CSSED10-310 bacterium]